jgi:hypothetical protein
MKGTVFGAALMSGSLCSALALSDFCGAGGGGMIDEGDDDEELAAAAGGGGGLAGGFGWHGFFDGGNPFKACAACTAGCCSRFSGGGLAFDAGGNFGGCGRFVGKSVCAPGFGKSGFGVMRRLALPMSVSV